MLIMLLPFRLILSTSTGGNCQNRHSPHGILTRLTRPAVRRTVKPAYNLDPKKRRPGKIRNWQQQKQQQTTTRRRNRLREEGDGSGGCVLHGGGIGVDDDTGWPSVPFVVYGRDLADPIWNASPSVDSQRSSVRNGSSARLRPRLSGRSVRVPCGHTAGGRCQ